MGMQPFNMGNFSDEIPIKPTGGSLEISERTPNCKRLITFGSILLTGGAVRSFQVFIKKERKNKRIPISPNDSSTKGLEGMQVLEEGDILEVDIADEADITYLHFSLSYVDYKVDSNGRY